MLMTDVPTYEKKNLANSVAIYGGGWNFSDHPRSVSLMKNCHSILDN
jgi:hypothetical protein